GTGLDIVSGGELYRAQHIGCSPKKIVYASVGKTDDEIKDAIRYGILMFNVESLPELKRIDELAAGSKKTVNVALRLNPDIQPKTHAYITTGKKETKFGMDFATVKNIFLNRERYANLELIGIHIHVGSQLTESEPFVRAIRKATKLIRQLGHHRVPLKYLNIGGGLGIVYDREHPQTAQAFSRKVSPLLKATRLRLILEPGRFIIGNAGILVAKVIYIKDTYKKRFIVVDAGMSDLIRPSLYEAYHNILPLVKSPQSATRCSKVSDVVGPICESGDFLGKDRRLSVREGEYVAVFGAGAYGFSMSSNYNSRPRAAEVLVDNNSVRLIRKRECYRDLVSKEIV
ncbi:MAG: diaminopimelate decarboxylase, partial [Candidatus Omnitrophota bacterium]